MGDAHVTGWSFGGGVGVNYYLFGHDLFPWDEESSFLLLVTGIHVQDKVHARSGFSLPGAVRGDRG